MIHFFVFGSTYLNIEIVARAYVDSLVGFNGISKWSLCGWTSLWMFLIGGLCGVLIGILNDKPKYYNLRMWQQMLIGGSLITIVELTSGIYLNLYLHLNIWDYSYAKYNLWGQICIRDSILWCLLTIPIIWLDDALSHYFYGEEKPKSIIGYFVKLIYLK